MIDKREKDTEEKYEKSELHKIREKELEEQRLRDEAAGIPPGEDVHILKIILSKIFLTFLIS